MEKYIETTMVIICICIWIYVLLLCGEAFARRTSLSNVTGNTRQYVDNARIQRAKVNAQIEILATIQEAERLKRNRIRRIEAERNRLHNEKVLRLQRKK